MYETNNNNNYPMYSSYPPSYRGPEPTFPRPPILKGRPVSSLEEARAAQIDFDGSLFIFPDIFNKKIYTKKINLDGTLSFNIYTLVEGEDNNSPKYVTKEELNETIEELKKTLNQKKEVLNF